MRCGFSDMSQKNTHRHARLTSLDFTATRDDGSFAVPTVTTGHAKLKVTNTQFSVHIRRMPFLQPNQKCSNTEDKLNDMPLVT